MATQLKAAKTQDPSAFVDGGVPAPTAAPPAAAGGSVHGDGGNPQGAGDLFAGQYDSGGADGGTAAPAKKGSLEPPGIDTGIYGPKIGLPMPKLSTDDRFTTPQLQEAARRREDDARSAQEHGDKPYDPIGDRLRGPEPPDQSPSGQKANDVVSSARKQLNAPDGGVPPPAIPGLRRRP